MDVARFDHSPIGHLEPIIGEHRGRPFEHFAFVPDDLPGRIDLSPPTLLRLTAAHGAVTRLDGAGHRIPNPQILVRPTIRQEAVSTSALEGTYTTLPRLLQSELFEEEQNPSREDDEVLGYVRASEEAFRRIKNRPVSLNMIKDLHAILLANDPAVPDSEKGEFRRKHVFIGPSEAAVEDSYFVPTVHGKLLAGLHSWEGWIHNDGLPVLVRAAIGHYQFETLHPFVNGNGRIGRLVTLLMLLEDGTLTEPLLSISPYLEVRRDEYHERLRSLSAEGDFDAWVAFFLDAIKSSAEVGLDKIERLLKLQAEMVAKLRGSRVRGLAIQATEDLIAQPVITAMAIARKYGVTPQAAYYTLKKMKQAGVVEEGLLDNGRHIYACFPVIDIIQP